MSVWDHFTHEQGQNLANELSRYRPMVGSVVRVVEGRAHKGKIGRVTWHGRNRFSQVGRYGDDFMLAALEVRGRAGYRVRVATDAGESFFVSAESVMVSVEHHA